MMSVRVERCFTGTLQTSLEMAGFSLCILHVNDLLLQCIDSKTTVSVWNQLGDGIVQSETSILVDIPEVQQNKKSDSADIKKLKPGDTELLRNCILQVCNELESNEEKLNLLDSGCGDGDCGTTLSTGAQCVRGLIDDGLDCSVPHDVFLHIANAVSESMGGSSGGLYSIFLTKAAGALTSKLTAMDWCKAIKAGTEAVMHYGGAEPGDRTMIDPLAASHLMLKAQLDVGCRAVVALSEAVAEAAQACQKTCEMKAKAGRASYVSIDHLQQPDAGATAILIILEAILETIKTNFSLRL